MRKTTYILLILLLGIFLYGCSDSEGGSSSNSESNNEIEDPESYDFTADGLPDYNTKIAELEDITLDVWMASDFAEESPIQDAVEQFESVYPNINVDVVGYPWEDIQDQIRKSVNGGNPPDMVHQDAMGAGKEGVAEPLDDLWEEWGKEDEYLNGALDIATWEDTKYGVPLELNTTFYFYDKQIFEEKNVNIPETLDDLVEISKELTDDNQYGFVTVSSGWDIYSFIVAQGGNVVEELEDGSSVPSLNNETVVEIVEKYTDMAKVDKSSPIPPPQQRQADNPIAMFGSDRAASFVSGPWDLSLLENDFPDKYENLGTAVVPGNKNGSVAGGGSLYVPKGSDNKEASFELMKWFTSDKYELRMAEELGRTPVKADLYDEDIFSDELLEPFIETLDDAKAYPLIDPEVGKIFDSAIRDIFDGDEVKPRLDKAQEAAEKAIERAEN